MLMPYYDMDTELLFLAGKGDGNIRYYECDFESGAPAINYVENFSSNIPTAGMGILPKRYCNVSVNEVVKIFKLTPDTVMPISFRVPRKVESFASDIFLPCSSDVPALNADQWLSGENANPNVVSLEGGFVERPRSNTEFVKNESNSDVEPSGAALVQAYRDQKTRIAYLEAELNKLRN